MIFEVLTQQGLSYKDEAEFALIQNEQGQIGILNDHIPIIVHIGIGHLKFEKGKELVFLVVEQAIVEFKDNHLKVLALEAQMGQTLEKAQTTFNQAKKERLEKTKKENVDFSKQERELKDAIRKSRAGQL
jgi:F-type H+-transporting ATPase subunit epsilon